jgi:hypothetical protein
MHEAFVTDITRERFLASVYTYVRYKRSTFYKSFTTYFTPKAFVSGVNTSMPNEIRALRKQLITHITLERSNSSSKTFYTGFSAVYFRDERHVWMKGTCVMREGVTVAKTFVAYLTAVWFITCVGARVDHEVVTEPERFIAHFTDEGLVSCVNTSVCY